MPVCTVYGHGHASRPKGVSLENGEHFVITYSLQTSSTDSPSNGASPLLEVEDVVYAKLWPIHGCFIVTITTPPFLATCSSPCKDSVQRGIMLEM